ncbi:MAG TPA: PBPRA1643 family SWIM/SEC-C metal-binding motif protein [Terriglobia bacterium]|nr:PBPRA1643 family SWIM/SEC-C metal-binding motif protein [Terriglobia bacterium]
MDHGAGRNSASLGRKGMEKIGTERHPAVVRVATETRALEIMTLCNKHGIQAIVGIEPDKPEDISDVQRLLRVRARAKPSPPPPPRCSPNDYCPCGSGSKYKNCCGGSPLT